MHNSDDLSVARHVLAICTRAIFWGNLPNKELGASLPERMTMVKNVLKLRGLGNHDCDLVS